MTEGKINIYKGSENLNQHSARGCNVKRSFAQTETCCFCFLLAQNRIQGLITVQLCKATFT